MFRQIAYPAVAYGRYLALMTAESTEELRTLGRGTQRCPYRSYQQHSYRRRCG